MEITIKDLGRAERLDRCIDCGDYDRENSWCKSGEFHCSPFDIACEQFKDWNVHVEKLIDMLED